LLREWSVKIKDIVRFLSPLFYFVFK